MNVDDHAAVDQVTSAARRLGESVVLGAQLQKAMAPMMASNLALGAQLQKAMAPMMASNLALGAHLQKATAPMMASNLALGVQLQKAMAPMMASNLALGDQLQKAMAPMVANWARAHSVYSVQWREITAALERWDAAERELMAVLAPRGWLIAPDLPMSLTPQLLRIRREQGLRALDRRLIRLFSPAYCAQLVSATYSRPTFRRWRPTLEKAMRAHKRREFPLAIPIWLMAIDGLAQDELSRPAIFNNLGKRARLQMARALETGGLQHVLLDAWLDVMVGIGGNRPGAAAVPVVVVDRHAVLHGLRPRVGGERDSIQCILVLHLLHYFLNERESKSVA